MTAKDLKNALLQEAVQGKLVPQIASEGNAKDLLNEIRKARHSELVSESKNKPKKEKPLPEITEEEIPFDIPENWCWCRLGELITFIGGYAYDSHSFIENSDYQVLRLGNVKNGYLQLSAKPVYINAELAEKTNAFKCIPNDILVTMTGTRLKRDYFFTTLITENDKNLYLNQRVGCLRPTKILCANFLDWILKSKSILDYIFEFETGTANQGNLGSENIKTIPIPLPPLAEQKRIVDAIEKFMPLIEEYGKKETELKALNEQIGTLTKKAILQEAVQGKLVPQIAAEGNAKDLLEEIKKGKSKLIKEGKIKKEKPLPEITEDEIPFDIPESWCWCRFSEIFQIINGDRGKNYPAKSTLSKQGIPFISALNLKNNTVEKDDQLLCVSESQYNKLGSGKLEKGDMVVCIRGSLGKHGIFPFEKGAIASSLVIVRQFNNSEILYKFLNIYLDSSLFNQEIKNYDNGTAQPNLAAESFKQFLFPLPPLAEQKRIVVAIEKMLSLCEKLGE